MRWLWNQVLIQPTILHMNRVILFLLSVFCALLVISSSWYLSRMHILSNRQFPVSGPARESSLNEKLRSRAHDLRLYCTKMGFNNQVAFLADMSLESGKNRFFVYDLTADSPLCSGLVAHGSCNETWLSGRKYGNTPGCGCTSLGRYKVGGSYTGRFGRAYRLYGLDSSNNNATRRNVVLHSFYAVPEEAVFPYPICQSLGCPMVAPGFFKRLQLTIDNSAKPIVLWIYE